MITRLVKLTLKDEMIDAFRVDFEASKHQIRGFRGCRYLDLLSDISDTRVFFTYSIWDSPDDLENYVSSSLFKSIWKKVKPMFAEKTEAWSTEVISTTGNMS